jgi:hypothetical protein
MSVSIIDSMHPFEFIVSAIYWICGVWSIIIEMVSVCQIHLGPPHFSWTRRWCDKSLRRDDKFPTFSLQTKFQPPSFEEVLEKKFSILYCINFTRQKAYDHQ